MSTLSPPVAVCLVDRLTAGGNIYPRSLWESNIARLQPKLAHGAVTGAVDMPSRLDGGQLKDSCLIWRELWIEGETVVGKYDLVAKHSRGADLQAQLEAGMGVSFAPFGHGTSHEPTQSERQSYNLGDSDSARVLNLDYRLAKINAVDETMALVDLGESVGLRESMRATEMILPIPVSRRVDADGEDWTEFDRLDRERKAAFRVAVAEAAEIFRRM